MGLSFLWRTGLSRRSTRSRWSHPFFLSSFPLCLYSTRPRRRKGQNFYPYFFGIRMDLSLGYCYWEGTYSLDTPLIRGLRACWLPPFRKFFSQTRGYTGRRTGRSLSSCCFNARARSQHSNGTGLGLGSTDGRLSVSLLIFAPIGGSARMLLVLSFARKLLALSFAMMRMGRS